MLALLLSHAAHADYQCDWVHQSESGTKSETVIVKDNWDRADELNHDRLKLHIDGARSEFSYSQNIGTSGLEYVEFGFRCDDYLNCSGEKITKTQARTIRKDFKIAADGSAASAMLGSREVMRFSRRYRGFEYEFIEYRDGSGKEIGSTLSCALAK